MVQERHSQFESISELWQDLGVQITGSALQEQIGFRAVALLRAFLGQSLHELAQSTRLDIGVLAQFSAGHITDSAQISLPQ